MTEENLLIKTGPSVLTIPLCPVNIKPLACSYKSLQDPG